MQGVKVYQPPGQSAQVEVFLDGLPPRLREKLLIEVFRLSRPPRPLLQEPHFKRFSVERYHGLYELRERNKIFVRIIFSISPSDEIFLLYAFSKRKPRDTNQALEKSLRILAELREHPEYAVEFRVKEEDKS